MTFHVQLLEYLGSYVTGESNIGLSPSYLRTCFTNSTKVESMSLQVHNIHVGNLLHVSLGHAIKHGRVIGSHETFSVQC